jgi:restriction system protein
VFDNVTNGVKAWLVGLFASAINHTTRPEDRVLAIHWLSQSRDIVASDAGSFQKVEATKRADQFAHHHRSNRKERF